MWNVMEGKCSAEQERRKKVLAVVCYGVLSIYIYSAFCVQADVRHSDCLSKL